MYEKCPKCGNWTYSVVRSRGISRCVRNDCNFNEKIEIEEYLENHNYLNRIK